MLCLEHVTEEQCIDCYHQYYYELPEVPDTSNEKVLQEMTDKHVVLHSRVGDC